MSEDDVQYTVVIEYVVQSWSQFIGWADFGHGYSKLRDARAWAKRLREGPGKTTVRIVKRTEECVQ